MATQPKGKPQLTHVSLIAEDIEESTEFYEEVIGCERIPTLTLGDQDDFETNEHTDIQMFRIGDQQLHLWNDSGQETESTQFAHFGIHVDNFEEVYRKAEKRDAFAAIGKTTAPPRVFNFNGNAQMYLSDPTGNLLEVDHPDIDSLDRSVFAEVVTRDTSSPDIRLYTEHILQSIS